MRRKRRNHSSSFNAKVAVAALKGDKTLVKLSEQIEEKEHKVKERHAKISQLTMEQDFLEQGLERIHGPKGKG
jgi:uncharacterized protein (DUF3084 family)